MTTRSDGFAEQLRGAYEAAGLTTPIDYWAQEQARALTACETLATALGTHYQVLRPLAVGGGGIALLLRDNHLSQDPEDVSTKHAVAKIARPVAGEEERMNTLLYNEALKLTKASHTNVIGIIDAETVPGPDGVIHYYIMEYIEGAMTALEYLAKEPTESRVAEILRCALAGLRHMHEELGLVHTDVKPSNLFCSHDGRIVVADFGFAKKLGEQGHTTDVGGTAAFMHPELQQYIEDLTSSQRDTAEANRQAARMFPRERLDPGWDVYSLGVTVLHLLAFLDITKPATTQNYARRYLRLMAYRMLDGHIGYARVKNNYSTVTIEGQSFRPDIQDTVLGLPARALKVLSYKSARDVATDLEKLRGRDLSSLPELAHHQHDIVNAASHSLVPFTERVQALVNTSDLRALGNLPQLGLVRLVYPTATHSRLEHTLGAFGMVCRLISALDYDPINPIFRQVMNDDDIRAGMVVALVHDVGHYPLAHDLEEAHKKVFSHEERTARTLEDPTSDLHAAIKASWGVDPARVSRILKASPTQDDNVEALKDGILRSLIDGPIDADKIDYVIRDSENLRIPYGRGVDYERLLQTVTVVVTESGKERIRGQLGIQERGRIAAESLAFARYALYGSTYWHRTHRAAKAMLNRVAYGVLDRAQQEKGSNNFVQSLRADLDQLLAKSGDLTLPVDPVLLRGNGALLDYGSEMMLRWLAELTDPGAKSLVEDILDRKLMKRVLVCSQGDVEGSIKWQSVAHIYGAIGMSWDKKLSISRNTALAVAELLERWDAERRPRGSEATTSLAQSFVADAYADQAVLLVDFPPLKRGSARGLIYLREAEWSESVVDQFRVDDVEESTVWAAVTESGYQAVGRLRVFCKPKFAPVIQQAVPTHQLEKVVAEAIEAETT